ncbi:MAG: Histidine biosynthesis protein [Synergistales bacterium 53_16]|nr:MAG: Histidine biosynthesis protein [Synergistales bacterium 53_16]
MILYPAIDLYDQKVVRLNKGDYDKMTEYDSRDPLEWGKYLRDCGAGWLHVIDLEGAKTGKPLHLNVLRKLAGLGLRVQYGGGLRDTGSIRSLKGPRRQSSGRRQKHAVGAFHALRQHGSACSRYKTRVHSRKRVDQLE